MTDGIGEVGGGTEGIGGLLLGVVRVGWSGG